VATREMISELAGRLVEIENEIKLLQTDRKELLSDFSDKIDIKAFKAAWSLMKTKKRIDESSFDHILDILEKGSD
jgi:hypothetical protein